MIVVPAQNKHTSLLSLPLLRTAAGEDALKKLDSSMKRNSAVIRKLRTLSEESHRGVLDDIGKTNQSKVRRRWWHYMLCSAAVLTPVG